MSRKVAVCAIGLVLSMTGCDLNSSKTDPPATRVAEILVEPNPVEQGETATFTVVHPSDGTEEWRYTWSCAGSISSTRVSHLVWTATVDLGEYGCNVLVERIDAANEAVPQPFDVVVVE